MVGRTAEYEQQSREKEVKELLRELRLAKLECERSGETADRPTANGAGGASEE